MLDYINSPEQSNLVEDINRNEQTLNELNQSTLDLCLSIFTLRSPVASDLRYVFAATHVAKILEHNGDSIQHSVKRDIPNLGRGDDKLRSYITSMIERNINTHNIALNAFIKKDTLLANSAKMYCYDVDESFSKLCGLLLQKIQSHPEQIVTLYNYILLGKRLEEIASRSSSIGRFICFIATGKFAAHTPNEVSEVCNNKLPFS